MSYPLPLKRLLAAAVILTLLFGASLASAKVTHHTPKHKVTCVSPKQSRANSRWNKRHKRYLRHHSSQRRITRECRPMNLPAITATTLGPMPQLAIGGSVPDNCSSAPLDGTSVVRIILYQWEPLDHFLGCAQNAVATDHRLIISVQYNNDWSIARDQQQLNAAIDVYGGLHPYEMSIGNEQFFDKAKDGDAYAQVWDALEPILAQRLPNTLRGAGEIDPWSFYKDWTQAVNAGLPGAQVYAGHAYPAFGYGFKLADFVAMARAHHVQAWITEGLCGPGSWMQFGCRTLDEMRQADVDLATEWYDPSSSPVASSAAPSGGFITPQST